MNKILLLVLMLLVLPTLTYATACANFPSAFPVVAYDQLTFTPGSGNTIQAGTDIWIPFNAGGIAPSYVATTGNNFVIFNGVSGAEGSFFFTGNVANTLQTTGLNTANDLGLWFNIPDTFSSADSNWCLGFGATTTNAFDSNGMYFAPQLTPGHYGLYDGGDGTSNPVFQLFEDFASGTPSGFAIAGSGSTTISDGLSQSGQSSLYSTATYPAGNLLISQTSFQATAGGTGNQNDGWCSVTKTGSGNCGSGSYTSLGWASGTSSSNEYAGVGTLSGTATQALEIAAPVGNLLSYTYWGYSNSYYGYGANVPTIAAPVAAVSATPEYFNFYSWGTNYNMYEQYIALATPPTNDVMPAITYGGISTTSSTTTSSTSSTSSTTSSTLSTTTSSTSSTSSTTSSTISTTTSTISTTTSTISTTSSTISTTTSTISTTSSSLSTTTSSISTTTSTLSTTTTSMTTSTSTSVSTTSLPTTTIAAPIPPYEGGACSTANATTSFLGLTSCTFANYFVLILIELIVFIVSWMSFGELVVAWALLMLASYIVWDIVPSLLDISISAILTMTWIGYTFYWLRRRRSIEITPGHPHT